MATSNQKQSPSDIGKSLLECPVCMKTIKSVPIFHMCFTHEICNNCTKKLNNCPICRNDSAPARNLHLEQTVQRLEGIQPENVGPTAPKPNLPNWGKGLSVRSYGTINGPNQVTMPRQAISRQATPRHATARQAMPRQAMSRQAMSRHAMSRHATTRQAMPRHVTIMINNQGVGHQTENNSQGVSFFLLGIFSLFVLFLFVLLIGHKRIVE